MVFCFCCFISKGSDLWGLFSTHEHPWWPRPWSEDSHGLGVWNLWPLILEGLKFSLFHHQFPVVHSHFLCLVDRNVSLPWWFPGQTNPSNVFLCCFNQDPPPSSCWSLIKKLVEHWDFPNGLCAVCWSLYELCSVRFWFVYGESGILLAFQIVSYYDGNPEAWA